MNHVTYCAKMVGDDFVWQQDLCSTHVSNFSIAKFAELVFDLLPWPSRSPDLNIIENCWSMIAQRVYDRGQLSNVNELWKAIDSSVTDIYVNFRHQLEALYSSMQGRLLQCIQLKGDLTNH